MESKKFYCGNCGKAIDEGAVSCPYCGAVFEDTVEEETPTITRPEVTFDTKVSRTVLGLENIANVIKVLSIIIAIIIFIGGIIGAADAEYDGGSIFFGCTIAALGFAANAYISYLIFNWLSHTLNCLYQLTKKKK